MGFLGDLISDILDGDGNQPFGQRIRSDNHALRDLYELTYFDFGLNSPRNLKENTLVPMKVSTSFGGKIIAFEIHGNIHYPGKFMSRSYGNPFNTINRELPNQKNRVWAYDISRLHEGILTGKSVFPTEEEYAQSEEYIKVLRAVDDVITPTHLQVPFIELEFGDIWNQFRIPDRIFVATRTAGPLSDYHLQGIINTILHTYNRSDAPPVTANYSMNVIDGTVTLVMRDATQTKQMEDIQKTADFINNLNAFVENADKVAGKTDDDFPYEFYRGLGLIDDEDMVLVPSLFGADYPVRTPMTDEAAKEHLLAYKPEN